jgi:2-dehydro-3-deoxy-L-rhamnonate aldolase
MAQANDELCLLIQVESKTALDNLDAILEVEGIDGVFIGPADLSASLGYPDNAGHPEVQRVIEQSIRRIRAAGKAAGFLAVDPEMAHKALAWGRILLPLASIPTFTPARWINGWRCSSR